uniref:INCENP_ARK-bind domain-containing protein n=1 Tax=Strongyloides stercoralis TaxID=6248 RepID=A0A0K0EKS0_STRER
MPKKNYRRRNAGVSNKNDVTNQFIGTLSGEDFILSAKNISYPNNISCKERLLSYIEELEEAYESHCLNIQKKILLILRSERDEIKCCIKNNDVMIKIPPTPIKGKNISQIDVMEDKITKREECIKQQTSLCKSENNFNSKTNIYIQKDYSETDVDKNNNDNIDNTYSNSKLNTVSNFGRKRRSTTVERGMCLDSQKETLFQAELRRKLLLDEKVKRIKLEREEKIKQVQEKLRQQIISAKNSRNKLLLNKDDPETSKETKLSFLMQKNARNISKEQHNTKNNFENSNNKPINLVNSKKSNTISKNKYDRKRKSIMTEEVHISSPPLKSRRYLKANDNMVEKKNKPTRSRYINTNTNDISPIKATEEDIDNESYKIENISDCETTDDENNPLGIVPKWAQFENLKSSLTYQSEKFTSLTQTEAIFGKFCFLKLHLPSNESRI